MYQSSPSSSSSPKPTVPAGAGGGGLIRYGSAPGSLLKSVVDEVIGASSRSFPAVAVDVPSSPGENFFGHFFSADSSSYKSESTFKVSSSYDQKDLIDRSYGFNEISENKSSDTNCGGGSYSLARQRSSPAGFFSYVSGDKNGFSLAQRSGDYNPQGASNVGRGASRLKSQLSFTGHESLSQIAEVNEIAVNSMPSSSGHSYAVASFGGTESWDDGPSSIGFTMTRPSKRAKDIDAGVFTCLNTLETKFSLQETSLNYMENFLQLPEDSVPCKVRAKRGCATHPRSIAERERRTRISGKLKKLQELVPNMDKQTSYSDMLDLAVQHIKGLQQQLQKLQEEQENCTCGCAERQ